MNTPADTTTGGAVPLDQLVALNDEMAALVRAGVPLELGLEQLGGKQTSALSTISSDLANRMRRGESLSEALAAEHRLPGAYRTIVQAGLRAGRLPAALEAVSRHAATLLELRQRIGLALVYPLIVAALAYGLLIVFTVDIAKRFQETFETLRIAVPGTLRLLIQLGDTLVYWVWIPPVVLLVLAIWWTRTGHAQLLHFTGLARPLGWIPGMRKIGLNYRCANFSELLSLLVEHEVPLPEAVVLAADAAAEPSLQSSARAMAEAIRQGNQHAEESTQTEGLPPYLRWLIARGQRQGNLARSLRLAADTYRQRAVYQAEWLKLGFPILACVVIGGVAVALYALALFVPLVDLMKELAA